PHTSTLPLHDALPIFEAPPEHANRRNGADPRQPVKILSVGRAVPKKGYNDLLEALALLPADLEWRFAHIGGGALAAALRVQAERSEEHTSELQSHLNL